MENDPQVLDNGAELQRRVEELTIWTLRSLSDEVERIGPGWVVRTRSLPHVWTLNQVRITGTADAAEVAVLADTLQSDLPYRHVVVVDEATGERIGSAIVADGWKSDREVLMALAERPDRESDTDRVVELNTDEMLTLLGRWTSEEHPEITSGDFDQLAEYDRREGRLWNERCFGVRDSAGAPAAMTKLRFSRSTAWVEDVYTVPEERNRGHARALVTHATKLARSAGSDFTFIIADDNDWPKQLYAAIGFRPIGWQWTFHRSARS